MSVKELANITHSPIKVLSARDGKLLCHQFSEEKHPHLKDRTVSAIWSEIKVKNYGFSGYANAVICVYVPESED